METIEWTPLFADHTPGYVLGYNATINGCKRVRMMRTDVRVAGYSGIEWQVKLQDKWCGPALFNAYGVASNFEQAKVTSPKCLTLPFQWDGFLNTVCKYERYHSRD